MHRRFACWLYFKLLHWYPSRFARYLEWIGWSIPRKVGLTCVGPGWADLVNACYDITDEHHIVVTQIKEKFGGLRFYVGSAPIEVFGQIDTIIEKSYHICEDCGAAGKLRQGGWTRTLCDACAENYYQGE